MVLLWTLVSELITFVAIGFCLLLGWAVYYHFSSTEMPPGICQPFKVRLLHIWMLTGFGLDYVLWKLGMCEEFTVLRMLIDGIPPMDDPRLLIKNIYFEDVPVRIYHARQSFPGKQKGLLFIHGGTGSLGSIDAYEKVCRHFALKCDAVVVSIGYGLSPEQKFPAQFEDSLKAAEFFMKNAESYGVDPSRIIISGDGFGATITAYVAQELIKRTDLPKPRAQVLISPFLQALEFNLYSYQQNRFVPVVSQRDAIYFLTCYMTRKRSVLEFGSEELHFLEHQTAKYKDWLSTDNIPKEILMRSPFCEFQPSSDPSDNLHYLLHILKGTKCSPLIAEDAVICQLPETFILTCEFDVLRDDGLLYKKRLEDHGVPVSWCHIPDGFHGLLYLYNLSFLSFPFVEKGVHNIVNYIKSL